MFAMGEALIETNNFGLPKHHLKQSNKASPNLYN